MYFHIFCALRGLLSTWNQSNSYSLFFSCTTETWILAYMFPKYALRLSRVKVTKREMFLGILFKAALGGSSLPPSPWPFCGIWCCQPPLACHAKPLASATPPAAPPTPPLPPPHLPPHACTCLFVSTISYVSPSASLLMGTSLFLEENLPAGRFLCLPETFSFLS